MLLDKSVAWDLLKAYKEQINLSSSLCKLEELWAGVRTCVGAENTCTCQTLVVLKKPRTPEGLGVEWELVPSGVFFASFFHIWWVEVRD